MCNPMLKYLTDQDSSNIVDSKIDPEETTKSYIGTYQQADDYIKDNEFIVTGYRIGYTTICKVLKSLFMCHNETVNIWTHF